MITKSEFFNYFGVFSKFPENGNSRTYFPGNDFPGKSVFPGNFPGREFPVLNPNPHPIDYFPFCCKIRNDFQQKKKSDRMIKTKSLFVSALLFCLFSL